MYFFLRRLLHLKQIAKELFWFVHVIKAKKLLQASTFLFNKKNKKDFLLKPLLLFKIIHTKICSLLLLLLLSLSNTKNILSPIKIKVYEKAIIVVLVLFSFWGTVSAANKVNQSSNLTKTLNAKTNTALLAGCSSIRVTAYSSCGQRLSFTVVCTGSCSCSQLADAADDFINDHTNSQGCFFL
ncbi:MAG: hypothetical protein K2X48_17690 [Chitinophagaceae bacterium]|nr:hypothetical protein [Chitinophagaceae bacterium]